MPLTAEANVVTISASVRNALGALINDRDEVKAFVKFLSGFGKVVVFGGFVRDAIHNALHADKQTFRDLDLVVVGTFGNGKNDRGITSAVIASSSRMALR